MDILRITENEVIFSEPIINCASGDEITELKEICERITDRYKKMKALEIVDGLRDLSPEEREEYRKRVNEERPGASELVDAALSVVESQEARMK